MDKEEEWVFNTNTKEDIAIGYDHIPQRILLVIVTVMLKII